MTTEIRQQIVNNFSNGNNTEVRRLLNKYSKNKQDAMENVLDIYDYLRGLCGKQMAVKFSVFIRT